MKKNVGGVDRVLRIGGGVALVAAAASGLVGAWGYVGLALLATGLMGACPLYPLLGINTCPMQRAGSK